MLLPVKQNEIVQPDGSVISVGSASPRPASNQLPPAIRRRVNRRRDQSAGPYKGMTWGPPIKYISIPHGEEGTRATLKIMKQLVLSPWGHRNPEVVWLARAIVEDVSPGPTKDYRAQAGAILDFMKLHVDYRLDPSGLEYVPTPWYTLLVSGKEDCDGHSAAIAALAMALGMKAGFRTVRGDPSRPEQWSHVYAVIGIPSKGKVEWLTADSTQQESFLGWDPPEGKLLGMKTWVIDPSIGDAQWDI